MAYKLKELLKSHSRVELRKMYQKLDDDVEARNFYHNIFDALELSVIGGDCSLFRKSAELLQLIHESENKDRLESYYKGKYPFQDTNVLLLVCEHNEHKTFSQVLLNYCNVLNANPTQPPISPTDENDEGKNAYYYLMRLNNVAMLRELIEKWPMPMEQHEVDVALSKSYFKLLAQKVPLTSDMIYFVEYTLNKLRLDQCIFGNLGQPNNSFKDIIDRSQLLVDTVRSLVLSHDQNARIINESTLYTLKHITLNLNILKRCLMCTYDRLPWEEIEFCLVTFLRYFQSAEEEGIYYRSCVDKENIFKYLNEFCVQLMEIIGNITESNIKYAKIHSFNRDSIVNDLSNRNSIFKDLYETFPKIRDFYSLNRMIFYIDIVLDNNESHTDGHLEVLLLEKCLQVLGESVKSSLTSPNLSTDLCNTIFECFSEKLQKMIKDMRNSFSHKYGLRRRVGNTVMPIYTYDSFMKIKRDLSEIQSLLKHIFLRIKFEKIEELLCEMKVMKSFEEYNRFNDIFNGGILENMDKDKTDVDRDITATCIFNKAKDATIDSNNAIIKVIQEFKSELPASIDNNLKVLFGRLELIIRNNKNVFSLDRAKYFGLISIARTLIITMDVFAHDPEKGFSVDDLKGFFEQNGLNDITLKKPKRLSPLDEQHIMVLLVQLAGICKSSKCISEAKLLKYEHQIRFLLFINEKNLSFMRNFHSDFALIDKTFHRWNNSFLESILDVKLEQLRMVFRKYHVENNFESISSFVITYGDNKLFLVIEMLLLDILSIYTDFLRTNTGIYDFYVPTLVGKELRNYLAHGNCAVEILDFNIKLCIVMNCVYFLNGKPPFVSSSTTIRGHQNLSQLKYTLAVTESFLQSKADFFNLLKYEYFCPAHISSKIDFLSRDLEGFTFLHAAAHNPDTRVFEICVTKFGGEIEQSINNNKFKQNIFHITALSNNLNLTRHLLQKYPNMVTLLSDFDYKACIPLHHASMFGTPEMVELLLKDDKDDILVQDDQSYKPVQKAILYRNIETFKVLVNLEKNINERYLVHESSLMHDAAEAANPDFLSILIGRGADVNIKTDTGRTPLHDACLKGRLQNVQLLLLKKADPNAEVYETARTPIYYAVAENQWEIVRTLLQNKASVHVLDRIAHYNLLHAAAAKGSREIIEELINRNVKLNALTKFGQTVLHVAVKYGNSESFKVFLNLNIDINAVDTTGLTALHMTAIGGYREMFELLLRHNANTNIIDFVNKLTPVQIVLNSGNIEMLQSIINFDIPVHDKKNWKFAVSSGNVDVVRTVLEKCKPGYLQSNSRMLDDLLLVAIRNKSYTVTKYLFEKGANINNVSSHHKNKPIVDAVLHLDLEMTKILLKEHIRRGDMPWCFEEIGELCYLLGRARNEDALLSIIELFIKHGKIHVYGERLLNSCILSNNIRGVRILLDCKLNVDIKTLMFAILKGYSTLGRMIIEKARVNLNSRDSINMMVLHNAAMYCDAAFVKFLISKGYNVNVKDDNEQTPIDFAAISGQGSIVKTLLENGAYFNKSLHMAAENDHAGIVEFLLQKGADVNGHDPRGAPLHHAIRYGSQNCINLLLSSNGINVNFLGFSNISPLHVAAQVGNLEVTKILVEMGADIHAVTTDNVKAIHFAVDDNHLDIIKYYIENGYISPTYTTSQGCTFLHYAANKANIEILEYFLGLQIDVNAGDMKGNTPLHIAALRSPWEKCKLLIDHGAVLNLPNKIGLIPYQVATERTKPYLRLLHKLFELVEVGSESDISAFLIAQHSDLSLNVKNVEQMSVLHVCVLRAREKVVEDLLKYDLNVNLTDFASNAPIHYAAVMNSSKITTDLVAAGAIYNLKNSNNCTPYDLARDERLKSHLSLIDKCFKSLESNKDKFIELIRNIENREDQIRILFGPRNSHNHTLYSLIVVNELTEVKEKIEKILNASNLETRRKADMFAKLGRYREAANILEPIVRKYKFEYGANNPMTLDIHFDLLLMLFKLNEYQNCVVQGRDIAKEQAKVYGKHSKIALKLQEFIGLNLHYLGENKDALKIYEDICPQQINLLGCSHEDVLQTKGHMVLVLNSLGRFEKALKVNYEVYDVQKRIFGENHLRTLVTLNNTALILNSQGKHTEAMKIYDEVSSKRAAVLGPTHPDTLRAIHNSIFTIMEQKKYKEAIAKLKTLYEKQKLKLGESHEETLRTKHVLAEALLKTGKAMEGNEIIQDIYPKINKIFGPNHPNVRALQMRDIFLQPRASFMSLMTEQQQDSKELRSYEEDILFQCIRHGESRLLVTAIEQNKELVNIADQNGVTPLHVAVDSNNFPILSILLGKAANPLLLTSNGNSILHTAVNRCNFEMVKTIIDLIQKSHNGVYFNFLEEKTKKTGKTGLHVAAQKNSYEICLLLLQKGAIYDSVTLLNQRPVDLTSNDHIKKLLNLIHEIFDTVVESDASVLDRIRSIPHDEIEALKGCRNTVGKTLVQYAPNERKQQIIKDLITVLKTKKK